jgi:hypothetical protein
MTDFFFHTMSTPACKKRKGMAQKRYPDQLIISAAPSLHSPVTPRTSKRKPPQNVHIPSASAVADEQDFQSAFFERQRMRAQGDQAQVPVKPRPSARVSEPQVDRRPLPVVPLTLTRPPEPNTKGVVRVILDQIQSGKNLADLIPQAETGDRTKLAMSAFPPFTEEDRVKLEAQYEADLKRQEETRRWRGLVPDADPSDQGDPERPVSPGRMYDEKHNRERKGSKFKAQVHIQSYQGAVTPADLRKLITHVESVERYLKRTKTHQVAEPSKLPKKAKRRTAAFMDDY